MAATLAAFLWVVGLLPSPSAALIRVGGVPGLDARDVRVVGRLAYVADFGFGLRVVDVSNPEAPVEIGGLEAPAALAVAVEGDLAVLSFGLPFLPMVVDLSDPQQPLERARLQDPRCWGRAALVDRIAYVGGVGLCVVDLSSPSQPSLLTVLPLPTAVTDVEVVGEVAFAATAFITVFGGGSLELVDVSKPATPSVLSRVVLPSAAYDVALAGDVAWVAHGSALTSIDVSDPGAATQIASAPIPGAVPYHRRLGIRGPIGYVTASETGLQALDLSDALSPQVLGSLDTRGSAQGIALVGNLAFVASGLGGALDVIDVSYPFAPVERSHHPTPGPAVAVELANGRAYVASRDGCCGSSVLEVLDVSDPGAASLLGDVEVGLPVRDVALSGETVCLAGDEFLTLDVSDPADPEPVGQLDLYAEAIETIGALAVTDDRKVDVSDPSAPVDAGAGSPADDFEIAGDLVYGAGYAGGFVVTELASAEVVSSLPSSAPGSRFAVSIGVEDTTAYVGEVGAIGNEEPGLGWLRAIDVSDPSLPVALATLETHGAVHDVEARGGVAYLATRGYGEGGVVAVDVANPAEPREIGAFATPGAPADVEVEDAVVHLADGAGGFRIIDFGPEYLGARTPVPLLVDVDARGGRRDRIKPGKRRLEAALLSSQSVSAGEIDPATLVLEPSGAATTGRPRLRDVSGDGVPDLIVRFALEAAGLGSGPVDVCVAGSLRDGRPFVGCDDVLVRSR